MNKNLVLFIIIGLFISCKMHNDQNIGKTEITKWQENKKTAISITYDDGIINQFTVAKPIMDNLQMPGTFYVITGKLDGAQKGKFIGRSPSEIIKETKTSITNETNFFERASLIAFTGTTEAIDYHSRAGSLYEAGKVKEAHSLMDEAYSKLRNGEMIELDKIIEHDNPVDTTTWDQLRIYAKQGHEIASHTVTHARLAVLDEANLLYELEQSKSDIIKYLGVESTFSAECPYGTENERVLEYAHQIYPSLRNKMPESYLEELNRSSKENPRASQKEYVQWQRGPKTHTSISEIKAWVDTCISHDNIWLVLVFHGVDGVGWEPKTGEELDACFSYINEKEENIWVATFADVTKYIRERKATKIEGTVEANQISIKLTTSLDPSVYNVPITLKTYIPEAWSDIAFSDPAIPFSIASDVKGKYVTYTVPPASHKIVLQNIM